MVVPKLPETDSSFRYFWYIGYLGIPKIKTRACKKYTGQKSMETENIVNNFKTCQEIHINKKINDTS